MIFNRLYLKWYKFALDSLFYGHEIFKMINYSIDCRYLKICKGKFEVFKDIQ